MEGTFIGVSGTELFYRKYQPNTTPKAVVIAVHGLGDHSGGLHSLLQRLCDNGYFTYAFDLRGHGNSSGTRGFIRTWDEYRGDLHEFRKLVESQTPDLPVFIIGHSLGGVISLDYTLHDGTGLAGLVTLAPAISYEVTFSEKLFVSLLSFLKPDYTLKKASNPDLLTKDEEVLARIQADPLRHQMVTPGLGRGLMQTVPRIMSEAHSIKLPFLLMFGLDDEITPPQKLRLFFDSLGSTNKLKLEYEATKHRPFDDLCREEFFTDLLSWLDQQVGFVPRD
jgi:alpha-beta hydrolase superfamily lysophospholipase